MPQLADVSTQRIGSKPKNSVPTILGRLPRSRSSGDRKPFFVFFSIRKNIYSLRSTRRSREPITHKIANKQTFPEIRRKTSGKTKTRNTARPCCCSFPSAYWRAGTAIYCKQTCIYILRRTIVFILVDLAADFSFAADGLEQFARPPSLSTFAVLPYSDGSAVGLVVVSRCCNISIPGVT